MSSRLFRPFTLKDMSLKNRIVMPPMCMYSSETDGLARPFHTGHYAARALGGCALIIQEATAVSPEGRISDRDLGIWNDAQAGELAKLTAEVHGSGAKMAVQLAHAGRKCRIPFAPIVAPSPLPFDDASPVPRELDESQIERIVAAFGDAARRARQAGYDAVEIHGAHGYLIHEFLSPLTNRRTDGYGGDTEGRTRFLREILKAVRSEWPSSRPVLLRVSAEDYAEGGINPEEMVRILKLLGESVDLVHVSSGGLLPVPVPTSPGYQVPYSRMIRESTGKPTIAVGLITEPRQAEEILREEGADLVALGRELLRNPHWPYAAAKELGERVDVAEQYSRAWM